jgi:hypothetical protein
MQHLSSGGFAIYGTLDYNGAADFYLVATRPQGQELWTRQFDAGNQELLLDGFNRSGSVEGDFILGGYSVFDNWPDTVIRHGVLIKTYGPNDYECCWLRGDINGDATGPNIADLVFLVNYMFSGGPEPDCMEEADINGNGAGPDVSDLVYLVTHMFSGGPPPASCP